MKKGPSKNTVFENQSKSLIFQPFLYLLIFGMKMMEMLIDALLFRNETFLVIFKQYEKGTQKGSKEISSDWRSAVDLKGN